MDYEKKYKKALEKAKESYHRFKGKTIHYDLVKLDLEDMFPELKESEDERIRKEIIRVFKGEISFTSKKENEEYIAWLEKQGEQKPADKIEPKFKVGDFLVNDYCMGKVIELTNDAYLLDTGQGIPFSCEHNVHLWTIQDAKEGDVLADGNFPFIFKRIDSMQRTYAYCGINSHGNFSAETESELGEWTWMQDIKPATKEQRDFLFQKMKDAGYEWDADKKELKKTYIIDEGKDEIDYCFTKMMNGEKVTPAWSEEDEEIISMLIDLVEYKEESMEAKVEFIAWLKSLKDRVHSQDKWVPSDELIQALERSADYLHDYGKNDDDLLLLRLLEELKKLKEE